MKKSSSCLARSRIVLALVSLVLAALLVTGSLQAIKASGTKSFSEDLSVSPHLTAEVEATQAISQNVNLIGQLGGRMGAVTARDQTAYIGIGPSLVILNIADPAHPSVLGQSRPLPNLIASVAISGAYAYVADNSGGLRIVDVSDPANPREIGAWPGTAFCVAVAGQYAYVGEGRGMHVIDVSDPASPQHMGFIDTVRGVYGLAAAGHYAYVGATRNIGDYHIGLWVMDVSDPAHPQVTGHLPDVRPFDVTVVGNYAYLADYYAGLRIVDIASPTNPVKVSTLKTPGPGLRVAISGHTAYLADYYGLSILDVSEPITLTQTAYYSMTGAIEDVALAGSTAYAMSIGNGLRAIDVSNPASPHEVGAYETLVSPSSVAVAGAFAYVAEDDPYGYGPLDMRIVNVFDPSHPFMVSRVNLPGRPRDVAVVGPYAYIADDNAGLRVINVLYATTPYEISSVDTPGQALGVAAQGVGNYVYVADGPGGLRVIKTKDPADPSEVGALDTPGQAQDVAIAGSMAYVADGSAGLRVINVANSAQPTELGFYDTPGDAQGVAVSGTCAYVADGGAGLRIINVTDPAHPTEVGSINTMGTAHAVAVAPDGLAYVTNGYDGAVYVINVADPTHPMQVGFYQMSGNAGDVSVAGGLVYLASGDGGLVIAQYHPGPPSASFVAYPTSGRHPLTVAFTDTSTGGVDAWLWSFGDSATSALPGPTHTYIAAGVYTVSLRVSNANGSDTLTRTNAITVTGMAEFTAEPRFGRPPLTVTFANLSTGSYTSSQWNFGDGITSTLTNPTHTFTALGAFTVTLTVSGPDGDDTEIKPAFIHVGEQNVYLPLVAHNYVPVGSAGTRFVAGSGTDNENDCRDSTAPCATVQRAVDVASPGDEIRVASATYTDITVRPRQDVTTSGVVTQVVYLTKTVTIRGGYTLTNWLAPDPQVHPTVLDAQGQGRVFYMTDDIHPTLEGLRITGGNAIGLGGLCTDSICYDVGGGIYAITATTTISGCEIKDNAGYYAGGGMYLVNGLATLNNNTVSGNTAGDGGGIYLASSDAALVDNVIYTNTATFRGGGIWLGNSSAVLTHNSILSNTSATVDGGGVYLSLGNVTLISNTIQGNRSESTDIKFANGGGGLYLSSGNATLISNTIQNNTARLSGGGMFMSNYTGTLTGNMISGNTAGDAGGGIYLGSSNVALGHNIVSGNGANSGGGIYLDHTALTLTHAAIHHNTASSGGGLYAWYGNINANDNLIYSNIAQGVGGALNLNGGDSRLVNTVIADNQAYSGSGAYLYMMATNAHFIHTTIARNTSSGQGDGSALYVTGYQFFEPGPSLVALTDTIMVSHSVGISITGRYTVTGNSILWFNTPITVSKAATAMVDMQNQYTGDPAFAADGYHLTAGSAAIDRGVDAGVLTDIDDQPRPQGVLPDLGADEYIAPASKASP